MQSDVLKRRVAVAAWLAAVVGAILFAVTWGGIRYSAGAFRVEIAVTTAPEGVTRLSLPPMGALLAQTHPLPIELAITLYNIDLESLRRLVTENELTQTNLEPWLREEARQALTLFLARLFFLAMLGGALSAWAVGRGIQTVHKWHPRTVARLLVGGALLGALSLSLVVALTWFTYDVNAFARPSYEGMLEAAPWMVGLIQDGLLHVEELGDRLNQLATNLYNTFGQVDSFNPQVLGEADFLVMHISDIHNHVSALGFIDQVAKSFNVDMIINTGDFTDWGTPLEAELVRPLGPTGIPHLFVSGNHESPEVLQRLVAEGIQVIDWQIVEVEGFTIMGIGDPGAHDTSPRSIDLAEARQIAAEAEKAVRSATKRPDILAVHNHNVARAISPGTVGVVLFGHSHTATAEQISGTMYVNAGTTGAAGIRGFESKQEIPFGLSLLHYVRTAGEAPRLLAIDVIEVTAVEGGFRMRRHLVQTGEGGHFETQDE